MFALRLKTLVESMCIIKIKSQLHVYIRVGATIVHLPTLKLANGFDRMRVADLPPESFSAN
eukprot:m.203560 g.203560  ORF g.203560 m.203560 type:complete len:61 (+) comp15766_c0_seq4:336-518(+)